MKKTVRLLTQLLLFIVLFSSCGKEIFVDGPRTTRSYELSRYNRININAPFEIYVTSKINNSIDVIANESVHEYIIVSIEGGTLYVSLRDVTFSEPIKVIINIPDNNINSLILNGASTLKIDNNCSIFNKNTNNSLVVSGASYIEGSVYGKSCHIELIGASRFYGDVNCEDVKYLLSGASTLESKLRNNLKAILDIRGASRIGLSGSTEEMQTSLTGSSNMSARYLTAYKCSINMKNTSYGEISVIDELKPALYNRSTLKFWGNPILTDVIELDGSRLIQVN